MADTPAGAPKPSYDAQGREVFTVHPEILSGGAPYRKVTEPAGEGRSSSRPFPIDLGRGPLMPTARIPGTAPR